MYGEALAVPYGCVGWMSEIADTAMSNCVVNFQGSFHGLRAAVCVGWLVSWVLAVAAKERNFEQRPWCAANAAARTWVLLLTCRDRNGQGTVEALLRSKRRFGSRFVWLEAKNGSLGVCAVWVKAARSECQAGKQLSVCVYGTAFRTWYT
jgi:hypothetical protein